MEVPAKPTAGPRARLPWHGWLLGTLFLLYSLAAAFDHVMSLAWGAEFYRASGMSQAQVAYFSQVPAWAVLGWTCAVWGGLSGALALLLRWSLAWYAFAASVAGGLAYILHVLVLSDGRSAMGMLWMMPLVITLLTALLALYSRRLGQRGVFQ